jgi:hypothetical protein
MRSIGKEDVDILVILETPPLLLGVNRGWFFCPTSIYANEHAHIHKG